MTATKSAIHKPKQKIDLISAFEYPSFKIPYEVLNQGFRNLHREMEHKRSAVRRTGENTLANLLIHEESNIPASLEYTFEVDDSGKIVKKNSVKEDFLELIEAWGAFQDSVRAAMSQMDWYTESLLNMIKRLRLELRQRKKDTELGRWRIHRDRTCRMIVSYLARCGRLQTAQKLSIKTGVLSATIHEWNQFHEAQVVYESLKTEHSTQQTLLWISVHRQKLRKMKSRLEMAVRVQDTLDLIRAGEKNAALRHARCFLNLSSFEDYTKEEIKEINQVWALIGLTNRTKITTYTALLDEDRYERLAEMFKEEFARLFDLPYQSAFSLTLQYGLVAYKTPQCTPQGNSRCITCQPTAFTLAEGLPHSQTGLSIIRCAFSGELLNEDNPPWIVMKTGRVYGEKSLNQLTRDDKFHCIKTDEWVGLKELQRLYIL